MQKKSYLIKIAILLVIPLVAFQMPHVKAASQLSVGDWWSAQGDDQTYGSGTGTWAGTYLNKENFTVRFAVTDVGSDTLTIFEHLDATFVCSSSGQWSCNSNKGSYSIDRYYTIALANLVLTHLTVNGNSSTYGVGHHTWIIQNPALLTNGGTTTYFWCTPTSDDTSCSASDVQATVSSGQLVLKGVSEKAYTLTYTGPTLGQFRTGKGVWSVGSDSEMKQYDSTYGVWVAGTLNATAKGVDNGGNWTDGYIENDHFEDTNLTFTAANATSSMASNITSSTSSNVGNPLTSIPGFPIESILLGVILALVILRVNHSKTNRTPSGKSEK